MAVTACSGERFKTLSLDASAETEFPRLESGRYVAWVELDDAPVVIGDFDTLPARFDLSERGLDGQNPVIFVSVEESAAPAKPSFSVLARGQAGADDRADLEFPTNLSSTSGTFILRTPTDDAEAPDNDAAGVWFLELTQRGARAALNLPDPGEGWTWQGWVETQQAVLTTGRFLRPEGDDDGCRLCGEGDTPGYPGEDFVSNLPPEVKKPVKLNDGSSSVRITLEPGTREQDPSGAAPFISMMVRRVSESVAGREKEPLDPILALPRVAARLERE
jgi:hypothetical protein